MALLSADFLQTKQYPASRLRGAFMDSGIQEGVVGATDLKVTQRSSGGAGMFVDVAAGGAWIKGDFTSRQGIYHVYNDAVVTLAVTANSSGNPRIDQVILRANDTSDGGSGTDDPQLSVLAGTPTSGATLTNRTGAATVPGGAVRLADVLVANGTSSIVNASIRDRRPWAAGAQFYAERNTDFAVTTTTTQIPGFVTRLEVSNPFVVTYSGQLKSSSVGSQLYTMCCYINGQLTFIDTRVLSATAGTSQGVSGSFTFVPYTTGPVNYEIYLAHAVNTGTLTLTGGAVGNPFPATMGVREFSRPSGNNA